MYAMYMNIKSYLQEANQPDGNIDIHPMHTPHRLTEEDGAHKIAREYLHLLVNGDLQGIEAEAFQDTVLNQWEA